jgi:hypothetical protein
MPGAAFGRLRMGIFSWHLADALLVLSRPELAEERTADLRLLSWTLPAARLI